jgi:hypothetical protein
MDPIVILYLFEGKQCEVLKDSDAQIYKNKKVNGRTEVLLTGRYEIYDFTSRMYVIQTS